MGVDDRIDILAGLVYGYVQPFFNRRRTIPINDLKIFIEDLLGLPDGVVIVLLFVVDISTLVIDLGAKPP